MANIRDIRALMKTAAALLLILALQAVNTLFSQRFWLNFSDSVPLGLYRMKKLDGTVRHGELVVMSVPPEFRPYIYGRGWMPEGWMLYKEVGAIPGDTVCVFDSYFTINGKEKGPVYPTDKAGLPLPRLQGCRQVPHGHFLPLATGTENSFDGRYMGPVEVSAIAGIASPVWTVP